MIFGLKEEDPVAWADMACAFWPPHPSQRSLLVQNKSIQRPTDEATAGSKVESALALRWKA
eukprot:597530-Pelagomonas_calceolata.AAC.8